ncbi:HNH endonuclease [uncultured Pseudodesulfovibrio sp.]|uniref:HNH endonuclease n=1 Tax=uncultured Pseudodesulfovibrio sp. TaxID=2035858 RepID=UPI0029C80C96|nr:HNH endonuclease [uncultured Pseudodesulfovibrio sp.]
MFRYTPDQIEFLREGYKTNRLPELTDLFNGRFGLDKTKGQIRATLKNHGLCVGWAPGNPKGTYRLFTEEQAEFIRKGYKSMSLAELTEAFNERFKDTKDILQIRGFTRNHSIKSGRTGRFEKGQEVWNKGTKGVMKPNSGNFKKGSIPANTLPMYTERINRDGFVEIKVPIANPYTTAKTRFMHKQVWVWEQANGPVPEGYVIRFLDGDKTNCSLDNLGLFSRAESLEMTRIGYTEAPEDVKPSVAALAKLSTKVRRVERKVHGYNTPGEVMDKVLETAQALSGAGIGAFSAHQIQRAGWPEVEGYKAVKLGISMALAFAVQRGKLVRVDRGLYQVPQNSKFNDKD